MATVQESQWTGSALSVMDFVMITDCCPRRNFSAGSPTSFTTSRDSEMIGEIILNLPFSPFAYRHFTVSPYSRNRAEAH